MQPFSSLEKEAFAAINADPLVCQYLPKVLTRKESDALADRIMAHQQKHGFSLNAVFLKESDEMIGFIGLYTPAFEAPFMPAVEIGWRLASGVWNKGLATEGAQEVLRYALEDLKLSKIVSFTTVTNTQSERVMQKIGLKKVEGGNFLHPALAPDHPLAEHVLYST